MRGCGEGACLREEGRVREAKSRFSLPFFCTSGHLISGDLQYKSRNLERRFAQLADIGWQGGIRETKFHFSCPLLCTTSHPDPGDIQYQTRNLKRRFALLADIGGEGWVGSRRPLNVRKAMTITSLLYTKCCLLYDNPYTTFRSWGGG